MGKNGTLVCVKVLEGVSVLMKYSVIVYARDIGHRYILEDIVHIVFRYILECET